MKKIMPVDIASTVRPEFPALVGDPGRDYIFGDAPTGTQVRCCTMIEINARSVLVPFCHAIHCFNIQIFRFINLLLMPWARIYNNQELTCLGLTLED